MIFFDIYMEEVQGKGRAMFANEEIPKDCVIENAPVIVMSAADRIHLDQTLLHDYIFEWHAKGADQCCMALGNVPIYNHAYKSNCEYNMDYETASISIVSVRKINVGEELTINYNGDWNDEKKVWFDVL